MGDKVTGEIYVLTEQYKDIMFGEDGEVKIVGYTQDWHQAMLWRNESHRGNHRSFERVRPMHPISSSPQG